MANNRADNTQSPPVMRDPTTGVTPTGPITAGDARAGRGNWGLAARWFLLAVLALIVGLGLWWIAAL